MKKILVIIRREFLERIRTRWFVISTVLGPLFMATMVLAPMLAAGSGADERSIIVEDVTSTGFGERLTEELDRAQPLRAHRAPATVADMETVADSLATLVAMKAYDGILIVTDATLQDGQAEYRGTNASSPRDMQLLGRYLEDAVMTERLVQLGVDPSSVRQARIEMRIKTSKLSGVKGAAESGEGSFTVAFVMWFVLYIAIIVYGVSVMGSVVEEKTSRVIEILVSSVRPFQLLAGKVIGVGGVGLFQLLIWAVSGSVLLNHRAQLVSLLHLRGDVATINLPRIPLSTGVVFVLYFLLGYFLYASMFAAVASMSSSEAEARQAQTPIIMLLVIPSVLMIGVLNDPNGRLGRILGLLPFSSPIAMPVRWAAAPLPKSELALSLGLLSLALIVVTWVASRIYRVGILMYGKQPSIREVFRWIAQP